MGIGCIVTIVETATPMTTNGFSAAEDLSDKRRAPVRQSAFGYPRDFLDNRFVYTVVSPRAHGLSVGINMCPDKLCSFDCLYCEVDRVAERREELNVAVLSAELQKTLLQVMQGELRKRPRYQALPDELLQLRHVALSGDGEPTLSPRFAEVVEAVVHVRALGQFPFFKIVLLTNAGGLDQPQVQEGLKHLMKSDEIWAKLDAGTQAYMDRLARPDGVTLEKVLSNILLVARQRPVVIQSLFPAINGEEPSLLEIEEYAHRLRELREAGARIPMVQIYSATRPTARPECGHLPLRTLSHIAQSVRQIAGLKAEVF
jgi:wyosine [tRNA(Phe)-imidazoG37] synthetase (radical SAM superfamily)